MSLIDALRQQNEPKKKVVDGQSYWHHSLLSSWSKNEEYRILKEKDWLRLLKSLKRYGVKQAFEIDINGVVYDGNNRLKGINELVSEGLLKAENGKELEWIPVKVHEIPQNEAEEVKLAAVGNGDKDFAFWNKDAVANHKELFETIEELDDLVFDYDDPVTFGEVFETYVEEEIATDEDSVKTSGGCSDCKTYHENNHTINQVS